MIQALALLLLSAICAAPVLAADKFDAIFAPLTSDTAALSPDGLRLAYSLRQGDQISIRTLEVDAPTRANCSVAVAKDEYAQGFMVPDFHNHPSRITWLEWTSPTRLVAESNLVLLKGFQNRRGAIFAFDHDGKNARIIYSAQKSLMGVALRGVLKSAEGQLLVQNDDEWVLVDPVSGDSGRVKEKDRFSTFVTQLRDQWSNAIRKNTPVVAELAPLFPGCEIKVLPHNGPSSRMLALVTSCADAGSFVVFDPERRKAWDLVRRAPFNETLTTHRLEPFDFTTADGEQFSGTIALPLNPRMKKAPLVLWITDSLGSRVRRDYHPEVQALASMGLAVAVVDGMAWREHEPPARSPSFEDFPLFEFDPRKRIEVQKPKQGVDLDKEFAHQLRSLPLLAQRFAVSARAVAVMGKGWSGQQALEAAITNPGTFRCVVALDPEPNRLSRRPNEKLFLATATQKTPPVAAVFARSQSKFVNSEMRSRHPKYEITKNLVDTLAKKGVAVDFAAIDYSYLRTGQDVRAALFRDMEQFLNTHLYRYGVELREIEVVDSDVPLPQR